MVGGKPIQPVLRIKRFETLGVRLLSPTPDPHPNPPSLRSGSPSHGLPPAVRRRLGSLHGEERNSSAARLPTTASPTSTAAIGSLALGSWLLAVELLRAGARALPGAPGERREAVESPAGLAAWMRPRISTGQGWPVRNPRPPHANPRHMDVPRARTRGGLLFGYFLLATQEKVTRAAQRADRKLLISLSLQPSKHNEEQEPSRAGVGSRSDLRGLDAAARRKTRRTASRSPRAVAACTTKRKSRAVQASDQDPTYAG
jgi:hypothetical protein